MPRLMSVSWTEQAVVERRKTVTRRLGWKFLKPADRLTLCRKVMGRRTSPSTGQARSPTPPHAPTGASPNMRPVTVDSYYDEQDPRDGVDGGAGVTIDDLIDNIDVILDEHRSQP